MEGLTAHIMVRDEPFIWYSVMSVLPYVDKILLWDTGSEDKTLDDIQDVLALDKDGKIDFQKVAMETDERYWNAQNWRDHQKRNTGRRGTGWVRQKMIDETKTDFFLIVDGDEVWYPSALRRIRKFIRKARNNQQNICGRVPLRWICDTGTYCRITRSTRVFKTDRVIMYQPSPGEMHMDKANQTVNSLQGGRVTEELELAEPYAHFETMLKPWRRKVAPSELKAWPLKRWPPVFHQERKYLDRYLLKARTAPKKDLEPAPPMAPLPASPAKVTKPAKPEDPYAWWHPKLREIWTQRCIGRCVVNQDMKLCFVFVAKNASSTVKRLMAPWGMLRYCYEADRLVVDDCRTFTILRDPYKRFVSAYMEVNKFREDSPWARNIALSLPFSKIKDPDERFRQFIRDINHNLFDLHLVSQTEHIEGSRVLIDDYLIFEKLDQQLSELMRAVGRPYVRTQANRANSPKLGRRLLAVLMADRALKAIIDRIYAKDFDLYKQKKRSRIG